MWKILKTIKKGDYLYALVPNHPKATKDGYVLEHRIVMENKLGRLLEDSEIVHHKNHNKHDNREENLEVLDKKEHNKMHSSEYGRKWGKYKCPICGKIFELKQNCSAQCKHPNDPLAASCCSRSCGCKFGRLKQLNRIDDDLKLAIKENVIEIYRKYTPFEAKVHQ